MRIARQQKPAEKNTAITLESTIDAIINKLNEKGITGNKERKDILEASFRKFEQDQGESLNNGFKQAITASICTEDADILAVVTNRYSSVSCFFYALLFYNTCTVLFELVWKHQVRIFTDATSLFTYGQWMSQYTFYLSLGSIFFALIGPGLAQALPQKVRSALTPILFALFTTLFFCLILFPATWAPVGNFIQPALSAIFGANASGLSFQIAALGTLENIIIKSSNYSIFKSSITEYVGSFPKQMKKAWRDIANANAGKMGKGLGGGAITLLGFFVAGGIGGSLSLMPMILGVAWLGWVGASIVMNRINIDGNPVQSAPQPAPSADLRIDTNDSPGQNTPQPTDKAELPNDAEPSAKAGTRNSSWNFLPSLASCFTG